MGFYLTLTRVLIRRRREHSKRWWGRGVSGAPGHCQWECKRLWPLWKKVWHRLPTLNAELPHESAIPPPPGIHPEELEARRPRDICACLEGAGGATTQVSTDRMDKDAAHPSTEHRWAVTRNQLLAPRWSRRNLSMPRRAKQARLKGQILQDPSEITNLDASKVEKCEVIGGRLRVRGASLFNGERVSVWGDDKYLETLVTATQRRGCNWCH